MTGSGSLHRHYRIALRGELSERFESEFEGMILESRGGRTCLRGTVDQSQLHGVLERIQDFNLEIIEVEEISESGGEQAADNEEKQA